MNDTEWDAYWARRNARTARKLADEARAENPDAAGIYDDIAAAHDRDAEALEEKITHEQA